MSKQYLCYDLKGIQQYIFQIPKLKCCIGGSRLIDEFDRDFAPDCGNEKCRHIYSGGGKGAFICEDEPALEELKKTLTEEAVNNGLTIRYGISADYTTAATKIMETYSYQPPDLAGQPCSISGLYPATEGIHPLIQRRMNKGKEHGEESPAETGFLEAIRKECHCNAAEFFYNVDAEDVRGDGDLGAEVLGNRNRWAVVCMDGNDMGEQFRKYKEAGHSEDEWQEWLPAMSKALDQCTRDAATAGMIAVVKAYQKDHPDNGVLTTLPIRPLIVGGDDVTILIHCSYAILFVQTVIQTFNEKSKSKEYAKLWCGTNGELTISAGILFAPVSHPLHSSLEYAEMLLASAKTHGRDLKKGQKGTASPACLDWESVTEGLLSAPHIRRQELIFKDGETGETVCLTKRPYSLEEFSALEKTRDSMRNMPGTLQYKFYPSLFAPKSERLAFYAKISKNWPGVANGLREPWAAGDDKYGSLWQYDAQKKELKNGILDAVLLLEESDRFNYETIERKED